MRAVSLFSGGLDSQLAIKLMLNQNIEIIALHFISPFFGGDPTTKAAAAALGIDLVSIEMDNDYLDILYNPRYGFGKNHNPCIDCHALMLKKAGELLSKLQASFIVTGEVLGQRPMSQNKSALRNVEKLSGYMGLVLRPLSALLLPVTIPEESGWVDRNQLLNLDGRRRNRQMELAEQWGIHTYPAPAGGCLLTQKNFSQRLEKYLLVKHPQEISELELLKSGRHFYKDNHHLLVIGRNQSDNQHLQDLAAPEDLLLKVTDFPGPLALLRTLSDSGEQPDLYQAAGMLARYSDGKNESIVKVKLFSPVSPHTPDYIEVKPLAPADMPASL